MDNQMGKILKDLRIKKGLTLEEVAKIVGVQPPAIYKYEKGIVENMKRETIKKLAELYCVKASYLMGLSDDRIINVYSSVHAGILSEMIENIVDTEEISEKMANSDKNYFGIKVKGDSMSPKYLENDTLIVEKANSCENGEDCIVAINGNEAFLKRVYITENGITLQSLNPAYEPLFYTNEQIKDIPITIIGIVRELRRKIWNIKIWLTLYDPIKDLWKGLMWIKKLYIFMQTLLKNYMISTKRARMKIETLFIKSNIISLLMQICGLN